jgi:ferredoxin--NADP+ reductase
VLYAVGAPNDRRLDIDGMGLPGTGTATEIVAWINGHPEFTDLPVDLTHERVVVIGNGNVALDVARILTTDADELARTDVSDHALEQLRRSKVAEVLIAARRGPADSAFTLPELIGLTSKSDVVLDAADLELVQRDLVNASDPLTRNKLEILSRLGDASAPASRPRIRLAYRLTPSRVLGDERTEGIEFTVTGTADSRRVDAGLVLSSIGYRGKPIRDLPFDEATAVVPNDGGRVAPGTYVAGWIKRGPNGFIGTNKSCAAQTVHNLVADYNAGLLAEPQGRPSDLDHLVRTRCPDVVDAAGWKAIDDAEIARGGDDRPRAKFTSVADMLTAAASAPKPKAAQRLLAALRN